MNFLKKYKYDNMQGSSYASFNACLVSESSKIYFKNKNLMFISNLKKIILGLFLQSFWGSLIICRIVHVSVWTFEHDVLSPYQQLRSISMGRCREIFFLLSHIIFNLWKIWNLKDNNLQFIILFYSNIYKLIIFN